MGELTGNTGNLGLTHGNMLELFGNYYLLLFGNNKIEKVALGNINQIISDRLQK